jgi:phospholipid/cholesterol/gamma-HCH transport system substrate-binding protein
MDTIAPKLSRVLLMAAFALSCIGLLVFLWIEFGGSVPLAAAPYRFSVEFSNATELGTQDDVEIAGVTIGHVLKVSPDRRTGLTKAVLEIDDRYAPRPANTRATLRAKSLLGETIVELSPGNAKGPKLTDGARLPQGQVAPTVSLDQILDVLDPKTRAAFQTWMQDGGMALTNRGEDFNAALSQLTPFATNVNTVLDILNRDSGATSSLLSHGATVLSAIAAQPKQLQALVDNSNTVFSTTARRSSELSAAVRAFPAFLTTAQSAVARLKGFSDDAQPLIDTLNTAAPRFSSALERLAVIAPGLKTVLTDLGPLTAASGGGVPALQRFLNGSVPFLGRATPYLGTVVPIINYLGRYREELAAFFANVSSATEATQASLTSSTLTHYLRISAPVNPESLTAYAQRPSSNRSNPYMAAGGYKQLLGGLATFGSYLCTANPLPAIGADVPASLAQVLSSVYYTDDPSGPACRAQSSLALSMSYPQLNPLH